MSRNMLSGNPAATTRTSRYVNAAAELSNDQVQIQNTLQENAPDYGQLSKDMAEQKRLNAEAAIKAQQNIRVAKMQGEYDLDKLKGDIKLKESVRKKKNQVRMAGKVAAAGVLYAEAKTRRDPDAPLGYDFSKQEADLRRRQGELDSEGAKIDSDEAAALAEIRGGASGTNPDPTSQTGGTLPMGGKNPSQALGMVIRGAEGTLKAGDDGYRMMFGGGLFDDTSRHPDRVISSGGYNSAAAGAYQFMPQTWAGVQKATGVKDFSPESQEIGYRYLTQQRGVDPDQLITSKEDFAKVMHKLSPEWASLPTHSGASYYGQPVKKLDELWSKYQQYTSAPQPSKTSAPANGGGRQLVYTSGNIGPTSTGQHLDVKRVDGSYFDYADLNNFVEVDDPELGTVPLGRTPETGDWNSHTRRGSHGRDYGLYEGTKIYLKNGAKVISTRPSEHGDVLTIQGPQGNQYTFLHGTSN